MYSYRATCKRIVGPLTLELRIDLGFSIEATMPIRLADLTQPDNKNRSTTTTLVQQWLDHNAEGFTVNTIKNIDKFGRYLGVLVGKDKKSLNDELLESGLVIPYRSNRVGAQ